MASRERYYYFRDRLEKELMARARGGSDPFGVTALPTVSPSTSTSSYLASLSAHSAPSAYSAAAVAPPAAAAIADPYHPSAPQSVVR